MYIYIYMCVCYICYIYTYILHVYNIYIYNTHHHHVSRLPSPPLACEHTLADSVASKTLPSSNPGLGARKDLHTLRSCIASSGRSCHKLVGPRGPWGTRKKEFKPVQIRGFEQGSTLHLKPFQLQFPLNNKLLIQLTNSRYKSTELHVLGLSIPRSPPAKARQGPQ